MAKVQYTYTVDILKQDALQKAHPGISCYDTDMEG